MELPILFILSCAGIVGCAGLLTYYMYQLLLLDATSRGIEKPKFWAVIGAGEGRGEGLLFYLFKRKNFSVSMTKADKEKSYQLKKRLTIILVIQVISALLFVIWLVNQK